MAYSERKNRLKATFQPREEWWSRVFATPIAHLILTVVADWHCITPNRLTIFSFGMTILSGILILVDSTTSLILAGIVLQVAYIIDCMDGQLARYRSISSKLGSLLDKWSDFVKFPFVIVALTIQVCNHQPTTIPIILGLVSIFLIGYQPYLKLIAFKECAIEPWNIFSSKDFLQRNLRFFLFEEAQWYLIVSICLLLNKAMLALMILVATQGVIAVLQTGWVFWSVTHIENPSKQKYS
ncbi:MAG TPA: CDP-alcohol phosphatidyltransferase family protein [Candidatus Handelsmanbacteria bacterium]|nr:CDP-alcohol phosphatidyltransferase family protein [Candidatus Handelsmanbacteria bacterium]HIL75002.1 CDP-alcohol phosphatidyltransferase family protein [Rhodospirillales bacterium]